MDTVTTTARFRIRVYKDGRLKGFVASGPQGACINRLKVHAIEYDGYDRAEQCANSWRDANPGHAFSVTQITTRMLAAALLVASLAAWHPASAQYSESEWRNHEQIFRLQQQQEADRNQYQLDQMRQQARDQQRDFDAYQARQDSLTRHYRSLGD